MLPELTASGKENESVAAETASSAAEDGAATGKRRRVEPAGQTVKLESIAETETDAAANAESGEEYETYGSIEEPTSSANFWKTQYYALHRQKDEKGMEQRLHTLRELSESREAQLKKYMFDVERRLKEAKDELAEIKKADTVPVPPGDILEAFPSSTESPMADANTNDNDGRAQAEAEAETKGEDDEVEAATAPNDTKHEEEMNQMKEEMNELSSTVKMMQQIISHYKMLTGVKLVNVQSDSFDVQLRNFQRSACATFRLTHLRSGKDGESSAAAEAELRLDPVDGAKYLPEFMRSPIEFGIDQCPSLLREALATMFPEEHES